MDGYVTVFYIYLLLTLRSGTHSSAKAALHILSETLRLEMSPFGVHVGCIFTGTVATKLHANNGPVSLPETSLYAGITGTITRWARGEAGPAGGSVDEYVDSIVPDVVGRLTRKRGVVWRGPNVGAMWFAATWLPTYVVVSTFCPIVVVVMSW